MAFIVLLVGIAFIIVAIVAFKLHPFLALILSAILVGLLSPRPLLEDKELKDEIAAARSDLEARLEAGELTQAQFVEESEALGWAIQDADRSMTNSQWILALELTAQGLGETAAGIAIVIVLAAIIGQCLLESGAADKITRKFLALLGEARASFALLGSGYFLSVPVFFDTVFFLLVPLARSLRLRTGKNYVVYVLAICAGAAITHSLVPPTPGPLIMVEALPNLDMGAAIGLGLLLGLLPALLGGVVFTNFINRRIDIPMREAPGMSRQELEKIVRRPESELPGFFLSILPVLLPVILITGHSIIDTMLKTEEGPWSVNVDQFLSAIGPYTAFIGNKNFALLAATFIAVWVLKRQKGLSLGDLKEKLEPAVQSAGVIILITSAGGAFGKMLARIGLSQELSQISGGASGGLVYIFIAWGVAAVMKIAQGSGTVSMITAAGIMASLLGDGSALPYHMIYIFAAIGFGSLFISWMNDSGFWVVCKLSGFTEKETLTTWTVQLALMGAFGLAEVVILSIVLPLV